MTTAARPLLITADAGLTDGVLALAHEAGVELAVAPDLGAAAGELRGGSLVLVDAVLLDAVRHLPEPERPHELVVVSRRVAEAEQWRAITDAAADVGAERVVELPNGAPWLFDRLARRPAPESGGDLVVVVGAVGGAGTSTLAAAIAMHAAAHGSAALVDLDPGGGGLDLMLGAEDDRGARWDELAGVRARVDERVLLSALPRVDGLPVLSWPPLADLEPDAVAIGHVLDAFSRGCGTTVVDAGRCDAAARDALARATTTVVVVPLRVRAVAGARRILRQLPARGRPLLVTREPAPGGLIDADVASALGLPVTATLPNDRRRPTDEEMGVPVPSSSSWRRICDAVLPALRSDAA